MDHARAESVRVVGLVCPPTYQQDVCRLVLCAGDVGIWLRISDCGIRGELEEDGITITIVSLSTEHTDGHGDFYEREFMYNL